MGSKRGKKAKKRAQREARRETRRAARAGSDPHIGYAAEEGGEVLRHAGGCIVVGSREQMQGIIHYLCCPHQRPIIHPVSFQQILLGLDIGEAFSFDQQAYDRLLAPAEREGMRTPTHIFRDVGPGQWDLVYVRLREPAQPPSSGTADR
jgi:hypothetical protein